MKNFSHLILGQSEWLKPTKQLTTNAPEVLWKRKASFSVGENANWFDYSGNQYSEYSEN